MPELPEATRLRLVARGLSERDTEVLMSIDSGREVGLDGEPGSGGALSYFDDLSKGRDPKVVVNWSVSRIYFERHTLTTDGISQDDPRASRATCVAERDFQRKFSLS